MAQEESLDVAIPRDLARESHLLSIDAAGVFVVHGEPAVYLPVAVSESPGGRPTIYQLPMRKPTLMGVLIHHNTVYRNVITRLSDTEYAMSQESPTGTVLFAGKGTLRVLDDRVGAGEIVFESEEEEGAAVGAVAAKKRRCRYRWYVWSFIATGDCD